MEVVIRVGDQILVEDEFSKTTQPNLVEVEFPDTILQDSQVDVAVKIRYDVDFGKRNSEYEYRKKLKESGVLLSGIRIENGISDEPDNLTFGAYVNEPGISSDERENRYWLFWQVSQYKRGVSYQTVVESSLKNLIGSRLVYPNNYSSGDLYGDVFVTKSFLDPLYDMNITLCNWDNENRKWTQSKGSRYPKMLRAVGRDYLGLGSCSNQLWLSYKPMDVAIGYDEDDERVFARRVNPDPDLNYQMVEVVKNINRFESSIKHKSNVFSIVVQNSNLAEDTSQDADEELEKYKKQLRDSVTQFVRNTCQGIVPVHTQLFDVQFT